MIDGQRSVVSVRRGYSNTLDIESFYQRFLVWGVQISTAYISFDYDSGYEGLKNLGLNWENVYVAYRLTFVFEYPKSVRILIIPIAQDPFRYGVLDRIHFSLKSCDPVNVFPACGVDSITH